jgi:RNA polymerase sigma factor (sigma-70 family)
MDNAHKTTPEEDPNRTRATLIQRVRNQRDEASWEDFTRIYRNYIYAVVRGMGMNESDAEDITQQVMLSLWNKLPDIDVEKIRRFRSWLSTVTKNVVLGYIRSRTRETNRIHKAKHDEDLAYLNTIRLPDIDKIAEQEWKRHITNLALQNVEPLFSGRAVEVFRLSLDGLDIQTVAEKLGLQENSVYRLKNRVKQRLVQEIEQLRQDLE